jgi:predicted PurR-regulated permease PerM
MLDEDKKPYVARSKGYRPFLLLVLFFSLYLAYLTLRPFLHILVFAIVIASLFYPVQVFLTHAYRGRSNLAAFTIVFIITFVIAIPVFVFISALVAQGLDSINRITNWLKAGNLQRLIEDPRILALYGHVQERFPFLDLKSLDIQGSLLQLSKNLGQFLLTKGAALLSNVLTLVSDFFIMVFIVFYLVRDGKDMVDQGRYFSPLRRDQEDRIIDGIRLVARSVLLGTFVTALSQGFVGGIGLAIVGIPALFWGTVMAFASLIPIVGTALIWIPASVYLVLLGKWKSAVFLVLWCIVLVGAIDNFVRPFLMQSGAKMSPFYIFLAIVGGVQYFGLAGILYGPLILSFAMIMLYIYGVEYQDDLAAGDKEIPRLILPDESGESSS